MRVSSSRETYEQNEKRLFRVSIRADASELLEVHDYGAEPPLVDRFNSR